MDHPRHYTDSRYFQVHPLPPLPPHHHHRHHPPPPPPPPQRPPPPQYHPPPPPPPQHHHHANHPVPHSEPYRPFPISPRVSSNHAHSFRPWGDHHVASLPFNPSFDPRYRQTPDDRQQFYPPRVSPIAHPHPNIAFHPNLEPSGVDTRVDFNRISPPFRETDQFRHGFRSDELRDWRSIIQHVERDTIHEEYHPEMLQGEFAINSTGRGQFMRESDDNVLIREDINVMYSDIQAPLGSRDVSCTSIQFQNMDDDDGYVEFYEEDGPELGRYYDRGRSGQDYNRTPRKNTRKKSALLRIQPHSKQNSFRNRQQDTTSSPHKGKESLEVLDRRLGEERDVELDVSFKSNSLVAKAIMAVPLGSDGSDLNGLDNRVNSKISAKPDDNRNCRDSSRKVEKPSENRVRNSPTLKKGGVLSNTRRSNSESPLKGSSSLNVRSTHRVSPKREISNKYDTNVGLGKVPSFSIRKKRKPNVLLSRLSSSPVTIDVKPVQVSSTEGHGHGEGSRPLMSTGGNVDDNDVDIISVDLDIGNSTSGPFGAPVTIPDRVDVTSETKVILSPENGVIEQSCGEERLDENDNNQNEMENRGFVLNASKATISSDKTVTPCSHDDIAVDSEKLTTPHSRKATDATQEPQCRGDGTMLVNAAESRGTTKASEDGDLTLVSMEEDGLGPVLNKKRKSRNEIQYSNVDIPGSSHDVAVRKSGIMMNSKVPVKKPGSVVLGLPCCTAELVLYQKRLKNNYQESITSIHVHDSFAIEYPSNDSKKNKISSLESSKLSAYDNCDLPASSDSLISKASVGLHSVEHSTQSAEGIQLSNAVLVEKSIVGGSGNQLQTGYCSANDSSADLSHQDPGISVHENSPLDGEGLTSFLPEEERSSNLVMGGAFDGSETIALESESRITASHQSSGIHCMENDHIGDSVHEPQVMADDNLPSQSDPPNNHAESTDHGATTNCDTMTVKSNVGFSVGGSSLIHSSDSKNVSLLSLLSDGKSAMDAKRSSKHKVTQDSMSSNSNSIVKSNATNSKPAISAAPAANQPSTKKYVVPVKNAEITKFPVNPLSRQFVRRNVFVCADGNSSSIRASPITAPNKAPSAYPVKPRTWRRTDNLPASNISVKKPSSSTPLNRPPIDRTIKGQSTSYIRKGNILVRNSTSGAATPCPHVIGATINQSKANTSNTSKLTGSHEIVESTVLPDSLMGRKQNMSVEMPKTPPLPCSGVISDHEISNSGDCRYSEPVGQPEAVDHAELTKSSMTTPSSSRNPETDVDKSLEDPGTLSDGNFPASESNRVVYVKRKSNQLIAASDSTKQSVYKMDNAPALSSENGYYKRRRNQLIRASSESNIQQLVAKGGKSLNLQSQKTLNVYSGRNSTKRQSNKVKPQKVSLVWKLGDTKSSVKGVDHLKCGKMLSHLLPWKRATHWRSVWRSSTNLSNNPSLMITRKLFSSRKRAAIYERSGRGFSLRRSKVIGLGGSSLKWSKSMEKRSKKANEEAAQAIAAMHSVDRTKTGASGERIFRIGMFRYRMDPSRRTLQRISDEGLSNAATSKAEHGARKTYVPKRLLIGSDEYVRIGSGNQLVRDPKRRTRLLASEKVRWSLHTARMRLAKKRKFCQFFTRFGKCNKGEGKCPYVHDPSKIAVCTKFLKGLCNDPSCKLTHKVIPERMPDCSFFLQGSCSNENCTYRHVNVNPKAPICETFLKGYCAEGNECRKKHSYICPEFEATRNCQEGSKCKLYHPKKEEKGKKKKTLKKQTYANSRGRYFCPGVATTSDPDRDMAKKRIAPKDALQENEQPGEFIRLDVSDDELYAEQMRLLCGGESDYELDELDELIKPLRLLDTSQGSADTIL